MIRSGGEAKVSRQMATVLHDYGLVERYQYPSVNDPSVKVAGYIVTGLVSIRLHKLDDENRRSNGERDGQ
jgi:hypothetical protein